MHILVNDERVECEAHLSVGELLIRLEQNQPGVALALNQQILPQPQWAETFLQDNDSLLIFQAIAGG